MAERETTSQLRERIDALQTEKDRLEGWMCAAELRLKQIDAELEQARAELTRRAGCRTRFLESR